MSLTDEQIAAWLEVAKAAGPDETWLYGASQEREPDDVVRAFRETYDKNPPGPVHIVHVPDEGGETGRYVAVTGNGPASAANAKHIAWCHPTNIRLLLTDLRHTRDERDTAKRLLDEARAALSLAKSEAEAAREDEASVAATLARVSEELAAERLHRDTAVRGMALHMEEKDEARRERDSLRTQLAEVTAQRDEARVGRRVTAEAASTLLEERNAAERERDRLALSEVERALLAEVRERCDLVFGPTDPHMALLDRLSKTVDERRRGISDDALLAAHEAWELERDAARAEVERLRADRGEAAAPPLPEGEPDPAVDRERAEELAYWCGEAQRFLSGLPAAPAPGVVFSEDVRQALTWARECLANSMMRTADYERVAAILDGLLSQPSPRPATLTVGEREAAKRRALAAERDRDEAVARAERAEAECGAMRAVVEAAERQDVAYEEKDARRAGHRGQHGPADPVAYERARSAYEIACARTCDAVDEWRRTRQSKERP